jgi:ABC-type molybdenum transport system ATPase subunit/photorepair protein PhrA
MEKIMSEMQATNQQAVIERVPGHSAMQLKDVAVSFNGRVAVRDATFDVAKNRVTSLIGPSGSGKTTLLRALNRLHDLTPGAKVSGQILLEGTDIYRGDVTVTELRTRVGMVFQRPNPRQRCLGAAFQRHQEEGTARRSGRDVTAFGSPLGQRRDASEGCRVESFGR